MFWQGRRRSFIGIAIVAPAFPFSAMSAHLFTSVDIG